MPRMSEAGAWREANQIKSLVGERGRTADYSAALVAIEEQRAYHERQRHVAKIAEELAPDPSAFQVGEYRHQSGVCACGQKIVHQFILKRNDGREVRIGSTCIDATVPYLISMGAEDLAEAVREQWKRVLAEMRRDQRERVGLEKLKRELPYAAALDDWYRRMTDGIDAWNLPRYFFGYRSMPDIQATTPARRAALIRGRVRHFLDRAPLLREALKRSGTDGSWMNPPVMKPVSDRWMEEWESMNEWRDGLKQALEQRAEILATVVPELVRDIEDFLATRRPIEEKHMTEDREKAGRFVGQIPTEEGVELSRREQMAKKIIALQEEKASLEAALHQQEEFHLRHRHDPKWHKEYAARTAEIQRLKGALRLVASHLHAFRQDRSEHL